MGACSSSEKSKVEQLEQQGAGAFHQNPVEASECFQKALDLKLANIKKYKTTLGKSYFILGACFWAQEKDCPLIIETINKGIPYLTKKQEPATSFAYYYMGLANLKLQKYSEAQQNISQCCTRFKENYGANSKEYVIGLEIMGNIYKSQKKFKEAFEEYKACAQILSTPAVTMMGELRPADRSKEGGLDYIDTICERLLLGTYPNISQIYFSMAEILLKDGKEQRADEACGYLEKSFECLFEKQKETLGFNDKLIRMVDLVTKLSFEYPSIDDKLMAIVKKWKKMKRLSQKHEPKSIMEVHEEFGPNDPKNFEMNGKNRV